MSTLCETANTASGKCVANLGFELEHAVSVLYTLDYTHTDLTAWWTDYDGVRLRLRNAATNGPIVHPPGDMWAWTTMVMIMLAGDNSWLVHQSSMTVLPAETPGASRGNGRRSENFAHQYLKCLKGSATCCKILRHGKLRLYFPSEGRCAADFYRP
jgi:hypothetical protein